MVQACFSRHCSRCGQGRLRQWSIGLRILSGFLGMTLLVAAGPVAAADGVSRFVLPNGLEGVVIEDHRAPVVTQMVWYKVGAADDPAGQSGLAHFLKHLMFKGTVRDPDFDFSRVVTANGGEDNAFTTFNSTAYFQQIASDRLDLVMGMEAERMTGLALEEGEVLTERDVILAERRERVEGSPAGPLREQLAAALYLNHPYGRPVIGWEPEIAAMDREAALAFYRAHYAPDNAVLVVAGDVTPEAVEAMAARHFGAIPAAGIAARHRPQEPAPVAPRRLTVTDARAAQPYMVRSYLAPARRPGNQDEAAALTLLAGLLGSGITSEFAQALEVGPQAVALGADAGYDATSLDPGSFSVSLVPRDGVTPEAAEAALDAVLARVIANGPDPVALTRLKARVRAREIKALDDPFSRADDVGTALTSGLSLADVDDWPARLQAVTAAEIMAVAAKVLRPEASVTAWLLPAAGAGTGAVPAGPLPDAGPEEVVR